MIIPQMQAALDELHKKVAARTSKLRHHAIDAHNQKVGGRPVNFGEGDYVMEREHDRKPSFRWRGPYRVIHYLSDYIFVIEDLLT